MKRVKNYLPAILGWMAAIGFICLFLGTSTSDYYVMELRQTEPEYVWQLITVGVVLMVPAAINAFFNFTNE